MSAAVVDAATRIPLVFTVPEMLRQTADMQTWTLDEWHIASGRVGQTGGADLLMCLAGRLPDDVLRYAVIDAWTGQPYWPGGWPVTYWRHLFRRAGYTVDGVACPLPSEPVRLWRGACCRGRRGMSWTDSPEQAAWFNDHHAGRGRSQDGSVWTLWHRHRRYWPGLMPSEMNRSTS